MIENFNEISKYTQDLFEEKNKKSKKYGIIEEIKKESLAQKVPIITDDVLNFMVFIAKNKKSKKILEVGTAIGYSGIFLAQIANENDGFLTTIEIDENRYKKAVENFEKMKLLTKNNLILGDALEEIPKLDKNITYDFIFLDAAKGQYINFFENIKKVVDKKRNILV